MTPEPSLVPVVLAAIDGAAGQLVTDVLVFMVAAWSATVFLVGAAAFAVGFRRARG